jgi:hypothetical protein
MNVNVSYQKERSGIYVVLHVKYRKKNFNIAHKYLTLAKIKRDGLVEVF